MPVHDIALREGRSADEAETRAMAAVMRGFVMALLQSLQRLLTRGQWRWTKPNALKCFRGRWVAPHLVRQPGPRLLKQTRPAERRPRSCGLSLN